MLIFYAGPAFTLRLLEPRDAEELFALVEAHREYFARFQGWPDAMTTVEATREFLIRALHTFAEQDAPYLGIVVEGKLAGAIGFNPNVDRHNRAAELFYYLAEPWQGQGYVTRAAAVLVTYGFRAMSLHRITLRAAAGNPRSWAVAERLGFHRDGALRDAIRQDDRFDDQYVYAMLEDEWPIDAAYMPIEG